MANRKAIVLLIYSLWFVDKYSIAQDSTIDSLTAIYKRNTADAPAKLELLNNLAYYETRDLNKALQYAEELVNLSTKVKNDKYLRKGYFSKGNIKRLAGKTGEALHWYLKSAELAIKMNNIKAEGESYVGIGDAFAVANNADLVKFYYNKAIITLKKTSQLSRDDSINLASLLNNVGDAYRRFKNYDSALIYLNDAVFLFNKLHDLKGRAYSLGTIGMVYANIGKNTLAEKNMSEAMAILESSHDYSAICAFLLSIADLYKEKKDNTTALKYTFESLQLAEKHGVIEQGRDASFAMSQLYENNGVHRDALLYYKKHIIYRDSISNIVVERSMNNQRYNYEMSQNQIQVDRLNQQNRDKKKLNLALGVILGLALITSVVLFRNFQNKQKAYQVLAVQKKETEAQQLKAEEALATLQITQNQLIQTAKMASLGELTAGIAHEIQNPLNFVNNFSEVCVELLSELKEMTTTKYADFNREQANGLVSDLTNNLNKIAVHGKRADSIVKGMLQHSRTSSGNKEPTNLNDLVQEFFRLSYHGIRAVDKTFIAACTTDFDEKVGTINVIPQDIGRVLLNIFNNAFYAVKSKKAQVNETYEPHVLVKTKRLDNKAVIFIKDNGIGIPKSVLHKIFQPFFTTKPTGEGTGLGLSLSYDIIKVHGGEIKVFTEEGAFTEFEIHLPYSN